MLTNINVILDINIYFKSFLCLEVKRFYNSKPQTSKGRNQTNKQTTPNQKLPYKETTTGKPKSSTHQIILPSIINTSSNMKDNGLSNLLIEKMLSTKNSNVLLHPDMKNQLRPTHRDDGRPHTFALTYPAHVLHVKLNVPTPLNTKNEVKESSLDSLRETTLTKIWSLDLLINFQI